MYIVYDHRSSHSLTPSSQVVVFFHVLDPSDRPQEGVPDRDLTAMCVAGGMRSFPYPKVRQSALERKLCEETAGLC